MSVFYFISAFLTALLIMLARRKWQIHSLSSLFLLLQLLFFIQLTTQRDATFFTWFTADSAAILMMALMMVLSVITFIHSIFYLKEESLNHLKIYMTGFTLLNAALSGVYLSNHIMVAWIFIEATTLSAALLIYHNRTARALEATWKYVFICSTGIAIAYMGILFISTTLRNTAGAELSYSSITLAVDHADPLYLKLAFLFVLVGFSAKLEVFPFYTISVDANYVAPAPASGFLSTALVNAGFISLFRIYQVLENSSIRDWMHTLLLITGVISLLIAAAFMQRVRNFKRMFAYSTVEHMGLVLIALGIGGIGVYAAFLQIIMHSFIKSSMFLQLGQAHKVLGSYRIYLTGDYFRLYPAGALVMILGLISLMAIPPSGLFFSEMMIFRALAASGNWLVLLLVLFFLCLVIYGMSKKVLHLIFSPLPPSAKTQPVNPWQSLSQYALLLTAILIGFWQPGFLHELIVSAINVITG